MQKPNDKSQVGRIPGFDFGRMDVETHHGASRQTYVSNFLMNMRKQREFAQGSWRLVLTYRHPGSRSEGAHGDLFHNDKPVAGQEPNQTLETDLGTLQYFGKEGGQLAPWMPTGWHFADPQKRLESRSQNS